MNFKEQMKREFENPFFGSIFTAPVSDQLNLTYGENMTFSYRLDDQYLLEDIRIPLEPGTFAILTGVENEYFIFLNLVSLNSVHLMISHML
jgi:hypothetical protein